MVFEIWASGKIICSPKLQGYLMLNLFNWFSFWLLNCQDAVTVVGYPLGGDTISVTKGVVSRIEVCLSY